MIPLLLEEANVHFRPRPSFMMDLASSDRAEICQLADAGVAEAGGIEVGAEVGEDAGNTAGRTKFWELLGEWLFLRVEIWTRRTIERAPYEELRWRGLTANRS